MDQAERLDLSRLQQDLFYESTKLRSQDKI